MILRIMGEGQVTLDNADVAELNELDDELMAAVRAGDEEGFHRTLEALLTGVRRLGTPLPDDSLEPSELILPAADSSLAEVREMLSEDGLIPG
jgi:PspAA-like protein